MSILSVPKEILSEIWSWLSAHEIKNLAQVCKELSSIWSTLSHVEILHFTDPKAIQPFLQKQNFVGAKCFKIRGHQQLESIVDISSTILAALSSKQLTSLDLDCRLIPNPENLIREMTSLELVRLYYKRYDNKETIDFGAMFPNHPHLRSFSIKMSDFEKAKGWEYVKNLEYLELSRGSKGFFYSKTNFQFPESVLTNLKKIRLQFLRLENTGVFKAFPNLTELQLFHIKFSEILTPLFDLPKLVSVHWQNTQPLTEDTIEAAGHMTQLTKLFFLDVEDYFEYHATDFDGVNNMTHLKQLAIIDRADVSGLTNLEKLRLSHNAVPIVGSAVNLPKLVDLSVTDAVLGGKSSTILTTLCTMTNLTRLCFKCRCRQETQTRPFLLDNLSNLRNLKELEIAPLDIGDLPERSSETINAISSITSLRVLTLINASVASVPEMSKLTQLELLKIAGKPQFDTCQIPLKNIPVEYYSVFDADELTVDSDS